MIKGEKGSYFYYLNRVLKKYQYTINFLAIVTGFTGLMLTLSQLIATQVALKQSLYVFKGEQYPILSFKILDKDQGMLQVENIIPNDMLFQFAIVHWHPLMKEKISNPRIRIYNKIWFVTPMTTYLMYEYNFEPFFKKFKKNSYLICEMPAALEINYVKYGESRIVNGLYDLELYVSKNQPGETPKYKIELHGAYLLQYLKPEDDVNKELNNRSFLTVIDGR